MTEQVTLQVATGFFSLIGTLFTGYLGFKMTEMKYKQDSIAKDAVNERATIKEALVKAADGVRETLNEHDGVRNEKLDNLATVAKATHALVNGNMSIQLRLTSIVSKRLADTTNDPIDIEASQLAAEMYKNHLESMKIVNAQPGTDAQKKGEK